MKKRVCQITTIPFAIRFLLLDQIKNLQEEGYSVSAVCSPGKWIDEIEKEGIPVKQITMKRKISPFSDLITLFKLYSYLRKEKFDIVHTSTPKAGLLGVLSARLAGVPVVIHSNLGFYFQKDSHWLKRNFFILIEKITAKFSNLVFSVAKPDIKTAIEEKICSPEKIKYMGWWVDLDRFDPRKFSKEDVLVKKRELGIDPNKKIIGINARLVRDKGYYELFEAFSRILKEYPNTLLLIIGPKEPKKKDRIDPSTIFKSFGIEKNVCYLGERTDVEELYPLMDVFVLPSYREGVAVSVLEALAMEVPVIASEVGGVPDSVVDNETGALIPPKNADALTEKLIYFLTHDSVKQFGTKGRKRIEENFNEKLVFSRIKEEYDKFSKIRICHIASSDITLKFMINDKLKFLQKEGYLVSAICSPGKRVKEIEDQGIPVKTITLKRRVSPLYDLIAFFKLYFYLCKEKFDIVHTHTLKPEILGQIAAKLARIPIIINTIHGFNFSQGKISLRQRFFLFLQRIAGYCSDLIFSISASVTNIAINKKVARPEQIRYLGRDINTDRFDPKKFSKEDILNKKKELGIDRNKKIIGIVARLVEDKGFYELFEALPMILKEIPNSLLIIIGPEEPEKKNRISPKIAKDLGISENILFLGERSDVNEIYPLMDVFVLPTHREGLGAVTLEASAMEIPVVVSNIGGCPETVENNKTGILIPLKDVGELAKAIIYILKNPDKAKRMGKNGRKKVLKEFNKEIVFGRMKREYQRLINQKFS